MKNKLIWIGGIIGGVLGFYPLHLITYFIGFKFLHIFSAGLEHQKPIFLGLPIYWICSIFIWAVVGLLVGFIVNKTRGRKGKKKLVMLSFYLISSILFYALIGLIIGFVISKIRERNNE